MHNYTFLGIKIPIQFTKGRGNFAKPHIRNQVFKGTTLLLSVTCNHRGRKSNYKWSVFLYRAVMILSIIARGKILVNTKNKKNIKNSDDSEYRFYNAKNVRHTRTVVYKFTIEDIT